MMTGHTLAPVLLAILQGAAPDDSSGGRRWLYPEEVMRFDAELDICGPTRVFRSKSGRTGVIIYRQDRAMNHVRIAEPESPSTWTGPDQTVDSLEMVSLRGESALLLVTDGSYPSGSGEGGLLRMDLARPWDARRTRIREGVAPHDLIDRGSDLAVLLAGREDPLRYAASSSGDGGRTWTPPRPLFKVRNRGSPYRCTKILPTTRGHHLFFLSESGGLGQVLSRDDGKTWTAEEKGPSIPPLFGTPDSVIGLATGRTLHLIATCWTSRAREIVLYLASTDQGRSWGEARLILKGPIGPDLAPFYHLAGSGKVLVFSCTDRREARFIASRDGGRTWHEEPVTQGIEGRTALACAWVAPDGAIVASFLADRTLNKTGVFRRSFILVRRFDRAPPVPDASAPGFERRLTALVARLGDADFRKREEATRELGRMTGIAPLLRAHLEKSRDAEIRHRLRLVLSGLEVRPEWWSGDRR